MAPKEVISLVKIILHLLYCIYKSDPNLGTLFTGELGLSESYMSDWVHNEEMLELIFVVSPSPVYG